MTSQEQKLSAEQKELVAVGASVGAGCQPCVSHHLKAGAQAGLGTEQLLAAVASAEHVGAEAAVAMGDHARAKLGASVTSPALLSLLDEALASLGAALGANDADNIARQLRAAAALGASRVQLQQAIDTAHKVQQNAARIHLREAERLLDAVATAGTTTTTEARGADDEPPAPVGAEEAEPVTAASGDESGDGCGCGADAGTKEAPATAEEPVAATGGPAAGCRRMAARLAACDASAAMARGREMFARFMSTVSLQGPTEHRPRRPRPTGASLACRAAPVVYAVRGATGGNQTCRDRKVEREQRRHQQQRGDRQPPSRTRGSGKATSIAAPWSETSGTRSVMNSEA